MKSGQKIRSQTSKLGKCSFIENNQKMEGNPIFISNARFSVVHLGVLGCFVAVFQFIVVRKGTDAAHGTSELKVKCWLEVGGWVGASP